MSTKLATHSTSLPNQPQRLMDRQPENAHERIKLRAYELYEERGRIHGHHEDDWADAEREIGEETQFQKAA